MSSPKNYSLEIFPSNVNPDVNVKKFVVKDKDNYFVYHLRTPLIYFTSSLIIAYLGGVFAYVYEPSMHPLDRDGISRLLASYNYNHLLVLSGLVLLDVLLFMRQVREDTMIVMKDIGIQLNSEGGWKYFGKSNERNCFIPQTEIMDLVIHEGFLGFGQVIFYMCILTKSNGSVSSSDETKDDKNSSFNENVIKIVFPAFLPRKDILLQVWKESREVLFGSSRRYFRRVPGQGLKECT